MRNGVGGLDEGRISEVDGDIGSIIIRLGYGVWLSNQHAGQNVHNDMPARLLEDSTCTLHINPEVYILLVPVPDEDSS